MKTFIIDGYNLLHRNPDLARMADSDFEVARELMLSRLASFLTVRQAAAVVVFDGRFVGHTRESLDRERLIVRFTKGGATADEYVVNLARQERHGSVVVVSSDEEGVRAPLSGSRAELMHSDEMWRLIEHATQEQQGEKPEIVTPEEVDYWEEMFRRGKPE